MAGVKYKHVPFKSAGKSKVRYRKPTPLKPMKIDLDPESETPEESTSLRSANEAERVRDPRRRRRIPQCPLTREQYAVACRAAKVYQESNLMNPLDRKGNPCPILALRIRFGLGIVHGQHICAFLKRRWSGDFLLWSKTRFLREMRAAAKRWWPRAQTQRRKEKK